MRLATIIQKPRTAGLLALAALAGLFAAPTAIANDSSAGLDTGGIVLLQNDQIAMEAEDLYISPEEVRIRYEFRNKSGRDQRILVAFPLPDVNVEALSEGDNGITRPDDENFVGFTTRADGVDIQPMVQHRAFVGGVDVTEVLARNSIPFVPPGDKLRKALLALPEQARQELASYGAISWMDPQYPRATWVLKTTFYWHQDFPAGRPITVEHRYKPVTGAFIMSADQLKPRKRGVYGEEDERTFAEGRASWPYHRYCMDDGFVRAALRRGMKDGSFRGLGREVNYVLRTGSNWAGPIKRFRLVVDKLSEKNLVSWCASGVKKIAPTRFEWVQTDFYPDRDLKILLIEFYDGN